MSDPDFHDQIASLYAREMKAATTANYTDRAVGIISALATTLGRTVARICDGDAASIDKMLIGIEQMIADLAAPSAPAEVEGLVGRFDIYLDDFDHLTKMPAADGDWMRYADHAIAMTEMRAENERLRSEVAEKAEAVHSPCSRCLPP